MISPSKTLQLKKGQFNDKSTKKFAYKDIYIVVKYVLCLIKKNIVNEKYKIIFGYLYLVIIVLYEILIIYFGIITIMLFAL